MLKTMDKRFNIGDDVYGSAYTASIQGMQRANIPPHMRGRWLADAKQEAAEAFVRCNGRSRAYAFTAARRQVAMWIFEFLREDRSHRNDGDYIRIEHVAINPTMTMGDDPESILIRREEAAEFQDILSDAADVILEIMKSSRKQQNGRTLKAAVRDANIILLALQGYNDKGIAHELGDVPENVRIYWRQASQIIEEWLGRQA